jgi:hypothetical protein
MPRISRSRAAIGLPRPPLPTLTNPPRRSPRRQDKLGDHSFRSPPASHLRPPLISRWRRDGERVWPDTGRCKGVCCCESAREITSLSRQGIAKETPGRLEYSERRLTHRKARRRRRRSKHGSARLFVDVTLATNRGGPVGGRQIGLESTMAAKYEGQRRVGVTGGSIERSQGFKKQPQP